MILRVPTPSPLGGPEQLLIVAPPSLFLSAVRIRDICFSMGNSYAVESLLPFVIHSCGRLAATNRLLLPTADILVAFLWLRMRPLYRFIRVSLGANGDACSEAYNRWWSSNGAPKVRVRDERSKA